MLRDGFRWVIRIGPFRFTFACERYPNPTIHIIGG